MPVPKSEAYAREESLRETYEQRKEQYMRESIPFMSYLHEGGWMFLRLGEMEAIGHDESGDGINRGYRMKHATLRVTRKGRKDFDRIVSWLQRKGTLIDVTYYLPGSR